ncbi:adenylyl-sulfate kinase [Paraburkholderia sp. CNPSo 3076]|uniref:adenylyl-sulfate kinase n=1 Tax=Paraburkholderia sp. CNPSo 3076 TaxID=2940936 RepID=UPI00224CCC5F|nr:adenylyl-sulfate kinase [Paraburkholderia sp. CNPSo 3076]MCX5543201.1 adenylyl-sulfate kinase [Paraburkholderia sp. CNPSo 3076]
MNRIHFHWDSKKVETATSTGIVIWLTGMSGAGKSTIARALVDQLHTLSLHATMLDGDVLRTGLNSDLGFSEAERTENLRRVAHVAALFCSEGFVAVAATISPEPEHRENARRIVGEASFVEVFVDTPLEICERRDPKGLYQRARRGEIKQFTGLGSPYYPPVNPDVVLRTQESDVDVCVAQLIDHLHRNGHITAPRRVNTHSFPGSARSVASGAKLR